MEKSVEMGVLFLSIHDDSCYPFDDLISINQEVERQMKEAQRLEDELRILRLNR